MPGAALGRAADVCSWSVVWQRRDMLGFVLAGEDREPDEVQHPRLWRGCCTCQQKLDTKLKKSGIKNESMYKIHQLF